MTHPIRCLLLALCLFCVCASGLTAASATAADTPDPVDAANLRAVIEKTAEKKDLDMLERTIGEAIGYGAQSYNLGNQDGMDPRLRVFFQGTCFKLYEGAAYKMIAKLGDRVPAARKALSDALAKTEKVKDVSANAWTMRHCFDAILGEGKQGGGSPPAKGAGAMVDDAVP